MQPLPPPTFCVVAKVAPPSKGAPGFDAFYAFGSGTKVWLMPQQSGDDLYSMLVVGRDVTRKRGYRRVRVDVGELTDFRPEHLRWRIVRDTMAKPLGDGTAPRLWHGQDEAGNLATRLFQMDCLRRDPELVHRKTDA